jgi:hypothetical protein
VEQPAAGYSAGHRGRDDAGSREAKTSALDVRVKSLGRYRYKSFYSVARVNGAKAGRAVPDFATLVRVTVATRGLRSRSPGGSRSRANSV